MTDLRQMNLKLEKQWVDEIDGLADRHGWSRAAATRTAIRALAQLMEAHDRVAAALRESGEDDLADLYLRLAREMPGVLVDVLPKERLCGGHSGDAPAFRLDLVAYGKWLV